MFYKCSKCDSIRFVSNRELKRMSLSEKNHSTDTIGKYKPKCDKCGSAMYEYNPEGRLIKNTHPNFR